MSHSDIDKQQQTSRFISTFGHYLALERMRQQSHCLSPHPHNLHIILPQEIPSKMSHTNTVDVYESFSGAQVTEDMIKTAAKFFSDHYGIWDLKGLRAGKRIRMSASTLRAQVFPIHLAEKCTYVRAFVDGELAGNVFACEWQYEDHPVLWITQLVVHSRFRSRGIAKTMLNKLKQTRIWGYGIASSHAHAIMAASSALGRHSFDPNFIKEHAEKVMAVSPIPYVRDAIFGDVDDDVIPTVDTDFFVDHTEPVQALESVKASGVNWFGGLPDRHEYLLFINPPERW